ncbi:MAG: hypothetical protein HZB73_00675 [Nitrosarchaeum sp.]|nr:hypothetical protein [Nitrosarchaeum sp.]
MITNNEYELQSYCSCSNCAIEEADAAKSKKNHKVKSVKAKKGLIAQHLQNHR